MRVGRREDELELARALSDRKAPQRHSAEIEVELARSGLDGEREGTLRAELEQVAGDAAEDGRDPLEGRLRLGDRDAPPFLQDPGRPPVGRVVADTGDPGLPLSGPSFEATGSQGDAQAQVVRCGVGDVNGRIYHLDPPSWKGLLHRDFGHRSSRGVSELWAVAPRMNSPRDGCFLITDMRRPPRTAELCQKALLDRALLGTFGHPGVPA